MAKLHTYDVTVYNMNRPYLVDGKPAETEIVTVKAKNQDEAERLAISGGLINLQSGWGVWDSEQVD